MNLKLTDLERNISIIGSSLTDIEEQYVVSMRNLGYSVEYIAKLVGVSRQTLYNRYSEKIIK